MKAIIRKYIRILQLLNLILQRSPEATLTVRLPSVNGKLIHVHDLGGRGAPIYQACMAYLVDGYISLTEINGSSTVIVPLCSDHSFAVHVYSKATGVYVKCIHRAPLPDG